MSRTKVKICGLREPERVADAIRLGAAYLGFVSFPASPRHVTPAEAGQLTAGVPADVVTVGLVVDPTDQALDDLLRAARLDVLQLHGTEPPARVAAIRAATGRPVMKVIRVAAALDEGEIAEHAAVADLLLLDTAPPAASPLPGGNGQAFNWRLVAGRRFALPWGLAGGLTATTVTLAVAAARPDFVDVSSGVESRPGVKNPDKLAAFMAAVAEADAGRAEPLGTPHPCS